jgi:hypothetical protein
MSAYRNARLPARSRHPTPRIISPRKVRPRVPLVGRYRQTAPGISFQPTLAETEKEACTTKLSKSYSPHGQRLIAGAPFESRHSTTNSAAVNGLSKKSGPSNMRLVANSFLAIVYGLPIFIAFSRSPPRRPPINPRKPARENHFQTLPAEFRGPFGSAAPTSGLKAHCRKAPRRNAAAKTGTRSARANHPRQPICYRIARSPCTPRAKKSSLRARRPSRPRPAASLQTSHRANTIHDWGDQRKRISRDWKGHRHLLPRGGPLRCRPRHPMPAA